MKILHISDTHAHGQTMQRLESLARSLPDFDVVACTGDSISNSTMEVPESWNEWPQRLKLIVPGNHGDCPETFMHLTKWAANVPWYRSHGDISFIGLDYSRSFRDQLEEIAPKFDRDSRAVVVLAHMWAEEADAKALARKLSKYFPHRPVLYLHGHDHRRSIEWEQQANLDNLACCRSKIISSASGNRGCAHLITWDGHRFSRKLRDGFPLHEILNERL